MSGLYKIVDEIKNRSEEESNAILEEAKEYADNYMKSEREKVEAEVDAYNLKASKERDLYVEKTKSGSEFTERNSILRAKQECIERVIERAYEKVSDYQDSEYFEFITKILGSNIQPGQGTMYFSERDLKRLPNNFDETVNKIAGENNGKVMISDKPAEIENGFILVYGEIEENCTFKALFDSNTDKLKDIVNRELFG